MFGRIFIYLLFFEFSILSKKASVDLIGNFGRVFEEKHIKKQNILAMAKIKPLVIIDLGRFKKPGSRVFTGREFGNLVREISSIDDISRNYNQIIIEIPEYIYSVNPSFLEAFIKKLLLRLGENAFRKKFNFISLGNYKIENDLEESIERILRENNIR